jgi:hypothetical protein
MQIGTRFELDIKVRCFTSLLIFQWKCYLLLAPTVLLEHWPRYNRCPDFLYYEYLSFASTSSFSAPVNHSLYHPVKSNWAFAFFFWLSFKKFLNNPCLIRSNPISQPVRYLLLILSRSKCVTIDRVWIGELICWPLIHTTRNYKQLQLHN